VGGACGHEHHRHDEQCGERRGEPDREQHASHYLSRAGGDCEGALRPQAERGQKAAEALEPRATERPEQVLRPVRGDERSHEDVDEEERPPSELSFL
jgi:hypothetical protein